MYRRRRLLFALTPLLLVAGIASYTSLHLAPGNIETVFPAGRQGEAVAAIDGSFELADHRGRPVTEATFRGRLVLIFFGYTSCPDICPTSLAELSRALDLLGEAARQVAFLFVTVDPARDTQERLAHYVSLFHPQLIGLTGSPAQVERAARAFRIHRQWRPGGGPADDMIDHSGFAYLLGRDGRLLAAFAYGTPPERIAAAIREHL
jgi:protein SCO1/2